MTEHRISAALSVQIVLASIVCTAYNLVFQETLNSFFPTVLLAYAPSMVLCNDLFLKKERSMRSLILFDTCLILVMEAVVFFVHADRTLIWRVLACPFLIFFSAYSVGLCTKPISYRTLLRTFDTSILVLLCTFAYISMHAYPVRIAYAAIIGASVSLFTVIFFRQAENGTRKSWIITCVCAFLVLLLMFVMIGYAPAVGGGLIWLWHGILRIGGLFSHFFDWLFSLLPKVGHVPDNNLIPWGTDDQFKMKGVVTEPLTDNMFAIVVIVVGSIVGFFILLYFLRGVHLEGRKRSGSVKKRRIYSVRFFSGIRKAFGTLILKVKGRMFIARSKENAVGLYFWLVKTLRKHEWRKEVGETPRGFLMKLEDSLASVGMVFDFDRIATGVEVFFYSPDSSVPMQLSEALTIRKSVRRILFTRRIMYVWEKVTKACNFNVRKTRRA